MGSSAATHAQSEASMVYVAIICSELQLDQGLYMVRPAPPAQLTLF